MTNQTKLEDVVIKVFKLKNQQEIAKLTQDQLDQKTEQIIKKLTPQDLINHTRVVYDRTANRFKADPHIQEGIVDELIEFMDLLNEGDLVLDLGCGSGRDTLFMTTSDLKVRKSLMHRIRNGKRTIEKYPPPQKTLIVMALDSSKEMLRVTWNKICQNQSIKHYPGIVRKDMHNPGDALMCHGVWSCTSLLVHTPKKLVESTIKSYANLLWPEGKFALSYIKEQTAGKYDNLLRSSTGNIKYFSQPNPNEIRKIAEKYDLKEIYFKITDFEIKGKLVKKDFFANHIFKKYSKTRD